MWSNAGKFGRFEWDEEKSNQNLKKYGISFEEAKEIFKGPTLTRIDDRFEVGEIREISFGMLGSAIVLTVAHTDRNHITRIISARKATARERRLFYDYLEAAFGRN